MVGYFSHYHVLIDPFHGSRGNWKPLSWVMGCFSPFCDSTVRVTRYTRYPVPQCIPLSRVIGHFAPYHYGAPLTSVILTLAGWLASSVGNTSGVLSTSIDSSECSWLASSAEMSLGRSFTNVSWCVVLERAICGVRGEYSPGHTRRTSCETLRTVGYLIADIWHARFRQFYTPVAAISEFAVAVGDRVSEFCQSLRSAYIIAKWIPSFEGRGVGSRSIERF